MASRMNMLKLVQEMHGFAEFAGPSPQPRPPEAQLFSFAWRKPAAFTIRPKRNLQVLMLDPPDLPCPVPIQVRRPGPSV